MSLPKQRRVLYDCGHSALFYNLHPKPGECVTCLVCHQVTYVQGIDSRALVVRCPECSRTVASVPLQATLTASVLSSKHNAKRGHHSTVVTTGVTDSQQIPLTEDE